ncbi:MAG: ATP-dependent DNA ligase, partial [Candidatus Lokiarchaeota archaeon]|nr:ATP-dependent DNA ligase [Candidatus Lokiarchaeota archaeon]
AMDPFYEKMLPFQVLSKRRRKYDIDKMAKEIPVTVFLFDLLMCEGEEYINHSFLKRKKKLEEIIIKRDELQIVVSKEINNTDEMVEFFNESREIGCEGIINKSIKEDSCYQPGNRGFLWIKLKSLERGKMKDSVDVVLIGGYMGRGRRKGVYGTLLGAIYNPENNKFEALTRIASGFTDEIMDDILEKMKEYEIGKKPINVITKEEPDIWFEPKVVIEIIGDEITISEKFDAGKSSESKTGFSIRFPVFLRFRDDKSPSQITTTQEIKNFYYEQ